MAHGWSIGRRCAKRAWFVFLDVERRRQIVPDPYLLSSICNMQRKDARRFAWRVAIRHWRISRRWHPLRSVVSTLLVSGTGRK